MLQKGSAQIFWDADKKAWVVRIQVGEEVMRRTCKDGKRDLGEDELRSLAMQTAKDDGYDIPAEAVTVKR